MDCSVVLKQLFYLDDTVVVEFLKEIDLLHRSVLLWSTQLYGFPHYYSYALFVAFVAFSEGVLFAHIDDNLLRHSIYNCDLLCYNTIK